MSMELVTVVVPARNEAADIRACLEAVFAQDWPLDRLEVVVVDGGSTDGTAAVAKAALAAGPIARWQVLDNPIGTTPSNLNAGLAAAAGDVVCRVDARSRVQLDHVAICARILSTRADVSVVGGAQAALARDRSDVAIGIARALNNRWTMGGSRYRSGGQSGPSDTVYLGAFRTAQLRGVGGWDERLSTNQDFDLNRRMASDGTVWFESTLRTAYVPRASLGALWRQYVRFGRAKVRYWRLTGDHPQPRQAAALALVPAAALAGLGLLRRRRLRAPTLLATAVLLAWVEHEGTEEPAGPAAAHAVGAGAMLAVGMGWVSGVWMELGRRGRG